LRIQSKNGGKELIYYLMADPNISLESGGRGLKQIAMASYRRGVEGGVVLIQFNIRFSPMRVCLMDKTARVHLRHSDVLSEQASRLAVGDFLSLSLPSVFSC
jgi:hypothetical protein